MISSALPPPSLPVRTTLWLADARETNIPSLQIRSAEYYPAERDEVGNSGGLAVSL
jgi:hypothetical protein